MVVATQRWLYELQVLGQLTRDNDPPLQPVYPTQIELDQYGLGDSSKGGFGSGLSMPKEGGDGTEDGTGRVHDRHGVWCEEHQCKSSNNRELRNLVEVVEEEVKAGRMEGVELFFMTKNSVAEAVYYRGNSIDKDIFEFMIRLVYLELRGCFILQIIWVAGTRQIEVGIYGFSRSCLTDGIASSGSILEFLPLDETAFERSVSLFPWVRIWIGVNNIEPLTPEGWFEEVHGFKGGKKNDNGI